MKLRKFLLPALLLLAVPEQRIPAQAGEQAQDKDLRPIQNYISAAWDALTRSMTSCNSLVDPKMNTPSVLYLPADFPAPVSVERLKTECKVEIKHLPMVVTHPGEIDPEKVQPAGLLFLEKNYVVPG